jgi:hypothetical protein
MKIAYLHGLESSIDQKDPKIEFLNKNFDKVYSPSINYKDNNTFSKLYKDIKSLKPDLIVGSSMGGYISYLIGRKLSIPVLLFNPAMVGRTFDPAVDDSNLKNTRVDVRFGKGDAVISGIDVRKYFKDNKVSFNYKGYDGGHRVPADVFINSIKDILNLSEIHNKTNKTNMKHIKLYEQFISEANDISQEGHSLNQLADSQIGGVPATEFQNEHDLDLDAITRAITHTKEINRYELRDIINGTAPKSKIKRFLNKYKK